jgi:hypothetical protein
MAIDETGEIILDTQKDLIEELPVFIYKNDWERARLALRQEINSLRYRRVELEERVTDAETRLGALSAKVTELGG